MSSSSSYRAVSECRHCCEIDVTHSQTMCDSQSSRNGNTNDKKSMSLSKETTGNKSKTRLLLWLFSILGLVTLVLCLDLQSGRGIKSNDDMSKVFQMESISVDASNAGPVVSLEIQFEYPSRLSSVTPTAIRCAMGATNIAQGTVKKSIRNYTYYTVEVTCPEQSIDFHAAWLWQAIIRRFKNALPSEENIINVDLDESDDSVVPIDDLKCEIDVSIHLMHFIPVHRTQVISKNDLDRMFRRNLPEGENENQEEHEDDPLLAEPNVPIIIRQGNAHILEFLYQVELPEWLVMLAPSLRVTIPHLTMVLRSSSDTFLVETEAVNFVCSSSANDDDDDDDDASMTNKGDSGCPALQIVVSLRCLSSNNHESLQCPWYLPILDWRLLALESHNGQIAVDATMEAGGSFMESLLGTHHTFTVDADKDSLQQQMQQHSTHRRRLFRTSSAMALELEEAATECLGMWDDTEVVEFALCWLLRMESDMLLTGEAKVFDTEVSAVLTTSWDLSYEDGFALNSTALVEMGEDNDLLNLTILLLIDWTLDLVQYEFSAINPGSWYPFEFLALGDVTVENQVLTVSLRESTWGWDGELKTTPTGFFRLDIINSTVIALLIDGEEDLNCTLQSQFYSEWSVLEGGSECIWKADALWNATWESKTISADSSYNSSIAFNESVSDFRMLWASSSNNLEDMQFVSLDNFIITRGEENLTDASGIIVLYSNLFQARLSDEGNLDYALNMTAQYDQIDNATATIHSVVLEQLSVVSNQITKVDISGKFMIDVLGLSAHLELADQESAVSFRSTVQWLIEEILASIFSLFIEELYFQWNENDFIDMTGEFDIFFDDSTCRLWLKDSGPLDAALNATTTWSTRDENEDYFVLSIEEIIVAWEDEIGVDMEGEFVVDFDDNSLNFWLDDAARSEFYTDWNAKMALLEGDKFGLYQDLIVQWHNETQSQASTHFELDFANATVSILAEDEGKLDYLISYVIAWWHPDDFSWDGTKWLELREAIVRVKDETIAHMQMRLDWYTDFNGDFRMLLTSSSNNSSDIHMDMSMRSIIYDENATMRMVIDDMMVGWKDTIYFDTTVTDYEPSFSPTMKPLPSDSPSAIPPPTSSPTLLPTTRVPTFENEPSIAPVPALEEPSAEPTSVAEEVSVQSVSFSGVEMKLTGAGELSPDAIAEFEQSLEEYYRDHFEETASSTSRRIAEVVQNFNTSVTVTGQTVDTDGNTVVYDQEITFSYESDDEASAEAEAQALLELPLATVSQREEYLELLREGKDQELQEVTSVAAPEVPQSSETDDDTSGNNDKVHVFAAILLTSVILLLSL